MNKLFSIILALTLPLVACGPAQQSANLTRAPQATQTIQAAGTQVTQTPATFPMTVADDTGRQVLVKAAPARIVSALAEQYRDPVCAGAWRARGRRHQLL